MAKHATLTPKSKKLVAAFAASGLVGTGLAVPMSQVALGNGAPVCDLDFTTEINAAKITAIQAALNGCGATPITIDGTGGGNSVLLGNEQEFLVPNGRSSTRIAVSISSETGFTIGGSAGTNKSLLRVEGDSFESTSEDPPVVTQTGWAPVRVTLEGLKFAGGRSSYGAGVYVGDLDTTLFVQNSTFEDNRALYGGGAIESQGDVVIDSSTFSSNQVTSTDTPNTYSGAAVYSAGDIYALNSTFENNTIASTNSSGGALYSGRWEGAAYLVHNTFLNNSASTADAVSAYSIYHFGNLFAQAGQTSDFLVKYGAAGVLVNTGASLLSGTSSGLGLETNLAQNGAPAGKPQTLALQAGSLAIDAVAIGDATAHGDLTSAMNGAFGRTVMPVTVDQRGFTRLGSADAGAFEFGAQQTDDDVPTSSTPFTPVVIEVNPRRITVQNEIVTLFGAGLSVFSQVIVDGKPVEVLSVSGNRITFRAPAGLTGTYDITLTGSSQNLVVPKGLTYATTVKAGARTVVPGFAANSIKLTKPMKKEIRKFLRANPALTNVVCKGFTSAPATAQDRVLARERGKVTCAFIKKLRPEANVTLRSGSHTDKPGLQIRRVQITLR